MASEERTLNYIANKARGLSKHKSAVAAGFSESVSRNPQKIERTTVYKNMTELFTDKLNESLIALTGKIGAAAVADELADNLLQKNDRGAKNKAIELAMGALNIRKDVEPENSSDKVMAFYDAKSSDVDEWKKANPDFRGVIVLLK